MLYYAFYFLVLCEQTKLLDTNRHQHVTVVPIIRARFCVLFVNVCTMSIDYFFGLSICWGSWLPACWRVVIFLFIKTMSFHHVKAFDAERCMKYAFNFHSPVWFFLLRMAGRHSIMNTFVNGSFIAINKRSTRLISFNFACSFSLVSQFKVLGLFCDIIFWH